jgi:hypothetical protein
VADIDGAEANRAKRRDKKRRTNMVVHGGNVRSQPIAGWLRKYWGRAPHYIRKPPSRG